MLARTSLLPYHRAYTIINLRMDVVTTPMTLEVGTLFLVAG
jgi:hypothetical protein